MNRESTAPIAEQQHFPVHLESLRVNAVLHFDLYLKQGKEFILYRSAALPFSESTRQTLIENNVDRLYVSTEDNRNYYRYLESNLPDLLKDCSIKESRRASLVYDSAKFLVQDLFDKPTLGENIKRSQKMVESTIDFILGSPTAITGLLEIMAYDYTTFTHSVNVCALSLALARFIGIQDPSALQTLGIGALLHDIGKTRVAESILNKPDHLTPDEMFVVRRHPQWGCDLARETDLLEPEAFYPILQHHERENGSGYPKGISGRHIHLYGKITAIADSFDAMTTRRTYREAKAGFTALKEMFADTGAFDRKLLSDFTHMLGPSDSAHDSDSEPSRS